MKIAISGVTLRGNLGGVAMLLAARQELRRRCPDAQFSLLSICPAQDRMGPQLPDVEVVWSHWAALITCYLPLSLLTAPVIRFGLTRWVLRRIGYFRTLIDCDAVVDLSGIAFVDNRGIALLAYNVAGCVPAIILGRRVLKLSQSLGPFERPLNRIVGGWVLRRCALVVPRGEAAARHVSKLLGQQVRSLPDTAFCLEVTEQATIWAGQQIAQAGLTSAPLIFSPSKVLERACRRRGIDLAAAFADAIRATGTRGFNVALLVHSQSAGIAKNDDLEVCFRIRSLLPSSLQPPVLAVEDPCKARALIGQASVFVGSRYHALVSAYAQAVPSLALSWNEKYTDLGGVFGNVGRVISATEINATTLTSHILELERDARTIRDELRRRLPTVRAMAAENFDYAERALVERLRPPEPCTP